MPKISIIVPVYQTEPYLKTCLDSLVGQSLEDVEILVINDGSTDGSQAIIDEYCRLYPQKIRSYVQPNAGQAAARNRGIRDAAGEYLFFVDSDDYLETDACQKAYEYAVENDLDVVCFGMYRESQRGCEPMDYALADSPRMDAYYVLNEASPCNKLIRSRLFFEHGLGFTERRIYEDLELIPQLVLHTRKIGYRKDCLYHYVIHPSSTMRQSGYNAKLLDIFLVMDTLKEKFYHTEYRRELEFLFIEHLLHAATLRFLCYEQAKEQRERIRRVMQSSFPRWRQNPYYKQQHWKYKLVCELAYRRAWGILRGLLGGKE